MANFALQTICSSSRDYLLAFPFLFDFFQMIIGGNRCRSFYVEKHIRPRRKDRILDIACGTGDMVQYLLGSEYHGFDKSIQYVRTAQKRYENSRIAFSCAQIGPELVGQYRDFDTVMAIGILHHLADDEARTLLRLAASALNPQGRLVTLDGCLHENLSRMERFLLASDRGRHVRTRNQYLTLAADIFKSVHVDLYHDLLRIPYSHIVMECSL
ncbi:MAG: class I SAM-dependent methyltransferase [Desulfobacteraceae bacterium]|nr:MAG: class I SAM-dependent methyltransferase [Desulfobacteraceae bacterium]